MFARKLAFFSICLFTIAANSAFAQPEARIRVVIPSISSVEEDLKWLVELSPTPDLKKQWKKIKNDLLGAFTQGVDDTKPLSVDLVFRKDELSYESRIPIKNLLGRNDGFLPSLTGMGYKNKAIGADFYEIFEKGKKPSYLRYDKNYAWMASVKQSIPTNPPLATLDLQPLLDLKKDVIAELKNDAAGLEKRRENFQELRKQFEALIRFKRNEDPNAFQLRKLALTQQLNEAERFLVETEELRASWTTNATVPNGVGRGELSLTGLPGTDLAKSIEQFAVKPSYFANVTIHESPVAVGRITFPLDSVRVAHIQEFYKSVRPVVEAEIKKRPSASYSDAQKAATSTATNTFIDMLEAGLGLGVVDGFIDCHAVASGKNVLVCGIRTADGKKADELVKILPELKSEWQVKLDVHEHGNVKIHELTVPQSRLESFQKIFPDQTILYVGTSTDAVWGAAGVEGLTHLKAAIDQAAQPAPATVEPVVMSYQVQVAQLVKLAEVIQKEIPEGTGKEAQQQRKDIEKYRKLAQDAMAGCDSLMRGELKRTDNKIEGFIELNDCVLKYVGSLIADGAKQLQ